MTASSGYDAPDALSISQLSRRAGVPPRRIRYYVEQELLPPPHGQGRAAHYTSRHLEILQQILAMREMNLSLADIRSRLNGLTQATPTADDQPAVSESWLRWGVAPGVELHARADLDEQTLSTIRVMVGAVRHVLERGIPQASEGADSQE